ncbi:MAG: lactate utilization protein C [Anaerotardibacter sp.]
MAGVTLDEFLKPFSRALGHSEPASEIEGINTVDSVQFIVARSQTPEQIVATFIEEAKKIGVTVYACSEDVLGATIASTVKELDPNNETVLFASTKQAQECGLAAALEQQGMKPIAWDASKGREAIQEAAQYDAGVTFAFGAIAETGSVVQCASKESGRSVCTIPPCHVGVVRRSKVYARMGQILDAIKEEYEGEMPSNISVISGPSATADIELVRVVGVHGPVHTAIVMIED